MLIDITHKSIFVHILCTFNITDFSNLSLIYDVILCTKYQINILNIIIFDCWICLVGVGVLNTTHLKKLCKSYMFFQNKMVYILYPIYTHIVIIPYHISIILCLSLYIFKQSIYLRYISFIPTAHILNLYGVP